MNNKFTMLKLAVEIHDPDDDVRSILTDGGLELIETNNGVAFEYEKADYQTLDDLSEVVTTSVFTLGIGNFEDSNYYDRPELTQIVADANAVDVDELDFSMLPDLSAIVSDNMLAINKARKEIGEKYYYIAGTSQEATGAPESDSNSEDGQTTEDNSETPGIDLSKAHDVYDPESGTFRREVTVPMPETQAEPANDVPSFEPEPDDEPNQGEQSNGSQSVKYIPEPDELLSKAAKMFTNADRSELPAFDEFTRKENMKEIVDAETRIEFARNDATQKIWDRLKGEKPKVEEAFEKSFQDSTDKHEATMKTIDDNEQVQIERLRDSRQKEYEGARADYVASQKQALEDAYDAKNLDNYHARLDADINKIKADTEALRHKEEKKFNDFKQEEKGKYVNAELSKVDIADVLEEFDQLVAQQVKLLMDSGEEFKGQVAKITAEMRSKMQQALDEAQNAKSQLANFKESYDTSLQAQVDSQVKDKTETFDAKIDAANHQLETAEKRADNYQAQVEKLQAEIRNIDASQSQLKNQLELANKARETAEAKRSELEKRNETLQGQLENTQDAIVHAQENTLKTAKATQGLRQSPVVVQQPAPVRPVEEKKSHTGGIVAGVIVGMVAALGIGMGGTYAIMHSENSNANNNVRTEQSSAKSASNSSAASTPSVNNSSVTDKVASYKAGDTWTYRASDGKDYTVTMDNATTGHYTSADGQQHQITIGSNQSTGTTNADSNSSSN